MFLPGSVSLSVCLSARLLKSYDIWEWNVTQGPVDFGGNLDHNSGIALKDSSLTLPRERSEWLRYCFRSMCLCMCACACELQTGQSDQFKTVKATYFNFLGVKC